MQREVKEHWAQLYYKRRRTPDTQVRMSSLIEAENSLPAGRHSGLEERVWTETLNRHLTDNILNAELGDLLHSGVQDGVVLGNNR